MADSDKHSTRPRIRFDWTISIGNIGTVVLGVVGAITAYSDLKSDVRATNVRAEAKYVEYDEKWKLQKQVDADQNERQVRVFNALNETLRDLRNDIRADIRDLNNAVRKPR